MVYYYANTLLHYTIVSRILSTMAPPKKGTPKYDKYLASQCLRRQKARKALALSKSMAVRRALDDKIKKAVAAATRSLSRSLEEEIRKKNVYMRTANSANSMVT